MATTAQNAAYIALVGLGLVLISCVLLVGLLRFLVALTAPAAGAAPERTDGDRREAAGAARERAAAAGVAVALAMHRMRTLIPSHARPQTSPWQEVMRAAELRSRGRSR